VPGYYRAIPPGQNKIDRRGFNARVKTNLICIRGCILQIYRIACVGYPMMMDFCHDTITRWGDAGDVDSNRAREVTANGTKSCVYEWLAASKGPRADVLADRRFTGLSLERFRLRKLCLCFYWFPTHRDSH
jgi:hypothetical protein